MPAGPLFGSPEWRDLFLHALHEAARLELELSLSIQSGWNLGGPDITAKDAAKQLVWSETRLDGPQTVSLTLPLPEHRGGFFKDVCVLAVPMQTAGAATQSGVRRPIRALDMKAAFHELGGSAPDCRPLLEDTRPRPGEEDASVDDILNLTAKLDADGRLRWEAPDGAWLILRFGYSVTGARVSTSSGDWQGAVLDYMNADVLRGYWQRHVQPLLEDAGPLTGTSLKYLHTDSWECGGMNWSPGFETEFETRRGYSPLPYLPVIAGRIIESREASNRFLADFRKTIGDCVADNHYSVFGALARQNGLGIHPESGGPHAGPFDALKCLGRNDVPMSEFWVPSPHRPTPDRRFFVKQAASAAHTYGRQIVAAEGFTSIGPHWDDILWQGAKPSFDHEACAGLNLTFIHTFTCSPEAMGMPGQEYFAGTHFNPNVTWWDKAGAVIGYLNRCQALLQQGQFVADVCYYYGDHVPNLVQLKEADPAGAMPGFDYDVLNEEVLCSGVEVREGSIVLPSGMKYRLLVLPDHRILSLPALKEIHQLVQSGASVAGHKPTGTKSLTGFPTSEDEFRVLADALWGDGDSRQGERPLGRGRVVWGKSAREVLLEAGVLPDCEFQDAAPGALDYIHRVRGDTDIYFIANQRETALSSRIAFRVSGKQPEIWDPLTAETRAAAAFRQSGGRTVVPLEFAPYGSMFVVFRNHISIEAQGDVERNFPEFSAISTIDGPWEVRFDPKRGGPGAVLFDKLIGWTERPETGIRYYSGTATYAKVIEISPETVTGTPNIVLDLGDLRHMASVRLEGRNLGVLWAPPFRLNVSGILRPGSNLLEVEVTNNWTNRLVGDAALPGGKRLTCTNIQKITAETPLAPSGLFGPVKLLRAE